MSQKVEPSPPAPDRNQGKATEQAARLTGTNRQYVADAKAVKDADPDLFAKVKAGELAELLEKLFDCNFSLARMIFGTDQNSMPLDQAIISALGTEAAPLLDELDYWGKQHEYQMSPHEVGNVGIKLRRVIDAVLEKLGVAPTKPGRPARSKGK